MLEILIFVEAITFKLFSLGITSSLQLLPGFIGQCGLLSCLPLGCFFGITLRFSLSSSLTSLLFLSFALGLLGLHVTKVDSGQLLENYLEARVHLDELDQHLRVLDAQVVEILELDILHELSNLGVRFEGLEFGSAERTISIHARHATSHATRHSAHTAHSLLHKLHLGLF